MTKDSPTGVRWVTIDEEPYLVPAPQGIIYSCNPRIAGASNQDDYYLKGPELEVVVAEHMGYRISTLVGLPVPGFALCRLPNGVHFASRRCRTRSAVDELLSRGVVSNPDFVSHCLAVDCLIGNDDRNVNNVVAEPRQSETHVAELHAIDFEKAALLRGTSGFMVTARPAKSHLPKGPLLPYCQSSTRHLEMCDRIAALELTDFKQAFDQLASAVGAISWADSASQFLASRAKRIHKILEEELSG